MQRTPCWLAWGVFALACSSGSGGDGSEGSGVAALRAPPGASRESVKSVVDGADPWGVLGELTGAYSARVESLANDCEWGPEVPFDRRYPGQPFVPFSLVYDGTLEQRGSDIVFEIGEGLVFAKREADRLIDVTRVGAEGVTHYDDGLEIARSADGFRISGESAWTFDPTARPEPVCHGRTSWTIDVRGGPPTGGPRDLQFVLRWPVTSSADLDLMIRSASYGDDSGDDYREFLGHVLGFCHVLHSAGTAGAAADSVPVSWIAPLEQTDLPYHEEIIRCKDSSYGTWFLEVVNWSAEQPVDFAIEVFEGPTIGVDRRVERGLGVLEASVTPHSNASLVFHYVPPPSSGGVGIVFGGIGRAPLPRPHDPISGSVLGFDKAAALDVSYDEFLANVGL